MILINSAAYVGSEFQAEIGVLPPCMLPIGNKKLIELQMDVMKRLYPNEQVILSIPESYELTINEETLIDNLDILVQKVPDSFSLAESVLYVLNIDMSNDTHQVRILHGDTLIKDLPSQLDVISITDKPQKYNWHVENLSSGKSVIWCGFFAFSSRQSLIKSLALSKGDFVKAINLYRKEHKVKLQVIQEWYDCGHINTFFNARANITTQRSFNSLVIKSGVVTKSSENYKKILAETNWFLSIPSSIKPFAPQLIDHGKQDNDVPYYSLEFLSLLPLNELFVHGQNPYSFWKNIFNLIAEFFEIASAKVELDEAEILKIKKSSNRLFEQKTIARLQLFCDEFGYDLNKKITYKSKYLGTLKEIQDDCITKALALPCISSVLHGDLCFSNMLFDGRSDKLKVIDPRGIDEDNNLTIYGNQVYDLAKLTHSVIGLYDFIIAGRYRLAFDDNNYYEIEFGRDKRLKDIQKLFVNVDFIQSISTKDIMPAVVLLFLSMLPLHNDRPDRQKAMLVNAFRLYSEYVLD
nr:hypothetical protein [uncultured Moraxella sp.]